MLVETVSNITKEKWSDVYEMNVYTFFNIVSFAKEKNNREKKAMEDWKRKH